jgi:hypothetical protein
MLYGTTSSPSSVASAGAKVDLPFSEQPRCNRNLVAFWQTFLAGWSLADNAVGKYATARSSGSLVLPIRTSQQPACRADELLKDEYSAASRSS